MKKIMIEVGGKEWPCRLTMGAMLLFKQNVGKDVSAMDGNNVEEMLWLMWCCIKSASRADGKEFDVDFALFCDMVTPADIAKWNQQIAEANEAEKKSEAQ